MLTVTVMSSFPRRYAALAEGYCAFLVVGLAWFLTPSALWETPQVVLSPLAVLGAFALVSRALAARAVGMRADARFDALTGLPNWLAWPAALHQWEADPAREHAPIGMVLIDIDHLKRINDDHGHARGDEVIGGVGRRLDAVTRREGALFRLGGEEFVLLAGPHDSGNLGVLAERLRRPVVDQPIADLPVTVSIGTSVSGGDRLDSDSLFEAADQALYRAKAAGRNRVMHAPGPSAMRAAG